MRDLKIFNIDISGICINWGNGLPQGFELAPGLFNIYTTYFLNQLSINDLIDITVFANNWVIELIESRTIGAKISIGIE